MEESQSHNNFLNVEVILSLKYEGQVDGIV